VRLVIVAVGQRVPDWAQTAWDDYAKRFPYELKVELKTVKTEPRGSKTLENLFSAERARIEAVIPKGCRIVALDERGTTLTTVALASKLTGWQLASDDVALVIGANDVTNPAARRPGNPISGMPILDVDLARSIVVIKRSLGQGYAGLDNELYSNPKTGMLFADAKKGINALLAALKEYAA